MYPNQRRPYIKLRVGPSASPDFRFQAIRLLFHRQYQETQTKVIVDLCPPAVYGSQADPISHYSSLFFEIRRIDPVMLGAKQL